MAKRLRNKKKNSLVKRVAAIGGTLVLLQVILIFILKPDPPLSAREAIDKAISKNPSVSTLRRREQLRIQLALNQFRAKNGSFPNGLGDLVPTYFDSVPVDPNTGNEFVYELIDKQPYIGKTDIEATRIAKANGDASGALSFEITDPSNVTKEQEAALIASLERTPDFEDFVYDPSGKRDPFRAFDFSPQVVASVGNSPLEKIDIGSLKVTAILDSVDAMRAIVEGADGRGHTIQKGTKIGIFGGEVIEITEGEVRILETVEEFTGEKHSRTIKLPLRPKEDK